MSKISARDKLLIVLSLVSLFAVGGRAISNLASPTPTPTAVEHLTVGRFLHLGGISLLNKKTVIVAIEADCPQCSFLVPVYSDIIRSALEHQEQAVFISPLTSKELGLPAIAGLKFVTEAPKNLGIAMSPEILWFDGDGSLKQEWSGRLTQLELDQIDASIRGRTLPPPVINGDVSSALFDQMKDTKSFTVVDVAERSIYDRSHRKGAIDIPVAELFQRARHELDQETTIVLDCSSVIAFDCDFAKRLITAEGFRSVGTLDRGKLVPISCKAPTRGSPN